MKRNRKLELKYFTLQYPDYVEKLNELQPGPNSKSVIVVPLGGSKISYTDGELISSVFKQGTVVMKIECIKQAAKSLETNPERIIEMIKHDNTNNQLMLFYQKLDALLNEYF